MGWLKNIFPGAHERDIFKTIDKWSKYVLYLSINNNEQYHLITYSTDIKNII